MKEHKIDIVEKTEENIFKGEKVKFIITYKYCSNTNQYSESEEMMNENSLRMKDAYRNKMGLLTSKEIKDIRKKYSISQADLAKIIGIGKKTITRYENHQVQDKAYDRILRKISKDPSWFLELVKDSKKEISDKSFDKYVKTGNMEFRKNRNEYLVNTIEAIYAEFENDFRGNVELNLEKFTEMVNYYATHIKGLYKVKLMKLLWYADAIAFKLYDKGMSGIVYKALPMGAVPEAYQELLELKGIHYDVEYINNNEAFHFHGSKNFKTKELTPNDIEILDLVIKKYGDMKTEDLVNHMHQEKAYKCTQKNCVIDYAYAKEIEI
jgi:putative zinc finger/helix-turn-helix YgiT family protein